MRKPRQGDRGVCERWYPAPAGVVIEVLEVTDVARMLIAAASENPPGDERRAAGVARRLLAERGITDVTIAARDSRRPNLLARLPGRSPGPVLALVGHLDTKPTGPRDAWQFDPFA